MAFVKDAEVSVPAHIHQVIPRGRSIPAHTVDHAVSCLVVLRGCKLRRFPTRRLSLPYFIRLVCNLQPLSPLSPSPVYVELMFFLLLSLPGVWGAQAGHSGHRVPPRAVWQQGRSQVPHAVRQLTPLTCPCRNHLSDAVSASHSSSVLPPLSWTLAVRIPAPYVCVHWWCLVAASPALASVTGVRTV